MLWAFWLAVPLSFELAQEGVFWRRMEHFFSTRPQFSNAGLSGIQESTFNLFACFSFIEITEFADENLPKPNIIFDYTDERLSVLYVSF